MVARRPAARIEAGSTVFDQVGADKLDELSDDELAERAKTSSDAFGALYDRHVRRIYSYIYYRIGQRAEAEDLTERVFMQALENLPRYEFRGAPFSAWLFRIAHNLVANWHRDTGRHPTTTVEEGSHNEIAAEMRRTEGAVKALLHRTLVSLRQDLTRHEVKPG